MEEIRKKISKKNSGSENGNSRSIKMKNIETREEIIFSSVKDVQNRFNIKHHTTITRLCKHERSGLIDGKWKVAYLEDDYDGSTITVTRRNYSAGPRKIEVEDLYTNTKTIYSSYREFEKINHLKYKSVAVKTTYVKGDTFVFKERYKITLLN